jgi:formamidopyrimidine-DNA glycosylase
LSHIFLKIPELDTVEATRALVHRSLVGFKVEGVVPSADDVVFPAFEGKPGHVALQRLCGRSVQTTGRVGKFFWITFSGALSLVLHLGMDGSMSVKGKKGVQLVRELGDDPAEPSGEWPPRFTKLVLKLTGGVECAFTNIRRIGRGILVQGDVTAQPPISELAPDALDALPELPDFQGALAATARPIKTLLLDQNALCSGIGNWIADEVLFRSRIHPGRPCRALSEADIAGLRAAIVDVLATAVRADSDHTKFPKDWLFHFRWTGKRKSSHPEAGPIQFVTVGGRTSAICPSLQTATGAQPPKLKKRKTNVT